MTSKEDQRAIGDTDLLEEEKKKKEEEEDSLVVGDDDDDDKQVKASDEGGNNTSSNGKRSAYPHDGDKQGADGTAKKCEMNSSPGDSGATMIEKNDHLAELDNDLTFEVASFVPRGLTLGNICVALGLEKAKLLRKTYQKYHLAVLDNNEALLVEVASFLPRGLTLRNICVALGLEKAKLLRRNYLKKNYRFLEEVVQDYETATWRTWGKQKATVDLRAWMAANTDKDANTDWKDVYRYWSSLLPGNAIATRDAYAFLTIFNPKMAIDLGLLKVLKFFVEEVDISASANSLIRLLGPYVGPDMEERIRRLYGATTSSLLQRSFYRDNFEAFEFLLSRVDIDSICDELLVCLVCQQRCQNNNDRSVVINSTKYFEAIVTHPQFSPNAEFALASGMRFTPLSLILDSIFDDFVRGWFRGGLLKKLEILLEAGADPNLPTPLYGTGFIASPLERACIWRDQPMFSTWRSQWQAVVGVFTDHSLVRSMAELSLHS